MRAIALAIMLAGMMISSAIEKPVEFNATTGFGAILLAGFLICVLAGW